MFYQLAKEFQSFAEPEGSLLCSQESFTGPCHYVNESYPCTYKLYFSIVASWLKLCLYYSSPYVLHDLPNKGGNLSFNFDWKFYGCNFDISGINSAWNTNTKYSQLFVSHLKVLVSLLHCLFLILSWMIIVMNVLSSEVNCRGEPRNWLRFFLLRNSHLLAIIANHSTLYGIVKQSKRDRWIS